jgi:hypothetical protein
MTIKQLFEPLVSDLTKYSEFLYIINKSGFSEDLDINELTQVEISGLMLQFSIITYVKISQIAEALLTFEK